MKKKQQEELFATAVKPKILVSDELRDRLNLEEDDSQLAIIDKFASVSVTLTCQDVIISPMVGSLRGIEVKDKNHVTIEMKMMTEDAENVFELFLQKELFAAEYEVQFCNKQIKSHHALPCYVLDMSVSDFDPITEMCIVTLGLVNQ